MTWLDDETGVETSQPREGIEIRYGTTVYRIATGSRDVEINGNLFKAAPAQRGDVASTLVGNDTSFTLKLTTSHPLSQRWLSGNPPGITTVTVWRKQAGGEVERIWSGRIQSVTASGHVATFQGDYQIINAMRRKLPTIAAGRLCPHVLYDANCRVPPAGAFRLATTVAGYDGVTVVLASIAGHPDQWAQYGELVHTASGERMTISSQVGTTITLQRPIFELRTGDAVRVFAGCDHLITTCHAKFGNRSNFGGFPHLPSRNPFLRTGLGVYASEPDE